MRSLRNVALIFSGLVLCAGSAFSQTDWPTRPITIVVPFPVGGQTDVVARIIADKVHWHCADITQATLPQNYFDVWHDRAVFHFLTEEAQRVKYVEQVMHSVKHGGYVIMSTFGPEGPEKCSGLEVVCYDAERLHDEFGKTF